MDLKPADNLTVHVEPDELLQTTVYVINNDRELVEANGKMQNFIAQAVWGRLRDKLPQKIEEYDTSAITVAWNPEEEVYEVIFWEELPDGVDITME